MDSLMDLIELMGEEVFTAWSNRHRASHGGQPPSHRDVERMLLIHTVYGPEAFQRMVSGQLGDGGTIQRPRTVNTAATQAAESQGVRRGDKCGEVGGPQFLFSSCLKASTLFSDSPLGCSSAIEHRPADSQQHRSASAEDQRRRGEPGRGGRLFI